MSKKPKTLKMAHHIPGEIRDQILQKLPIKSLVRLTCVSKSFFSLIKNLSISCSNKNPHLILLLRHYTPNENDYTFTVNHSLYFDKEEGYSHYMHLHFPFKTHNPNSRLHVVGTINGLICVVNDIKIDTQETIIIWNPLIKKSVTLPKPTSTTCNHHRVSYGFGFDSRSNDYKVLRLANRFFEVPRGEQDTLEAEIYSLNMNSWKRIRAPRAGYEVSHLDRQVFVNGVMHVMAHWRHKWDTKYRSLILGFDMGGDELFNEIELPQSLLIGYPFNLNVLVYKESSIAVFQSDVVGPVGRHLWVMEQYGVVESWTRMLSFHGQEDELPTVLGFRKNGELFLQMPDQEIVSCEAGESRESENKSLGVSGCYPTIDYFVESLELLDNANAESDPTVVENDAIGDAATAAVND